MSKQPTEVQTRSTEIKVDKNPVDVSKQLTEALTVQSKSTKIMIDGDSVNIKQYLPIRDKSDIITIVLENSKENGVYNPVLIDMYFHVYLVFSYSDIPFSDEEKEQVEQIYDLLCSNGYMDAIIKAIPETEYQYLYNALNELKNDKLQYGSTFISALSWIMDALPNMVSTAEEILQTADFDKMETLRDVLTYFNAGQEKADMIDNN